MIKQRSMEEIVNDRKDHKTLPVKSVGLKYKRLNMSW